MQSGQSLLALLEQHKAKAEHARQAEEGTDEEAAPAKSSTDQSAGADAHAAPPKDAHNQQHRQAFAPTLKDRARASIPEGGEPRPVSTSPAHCRCVGDGLETCTTRKLAVFTIEAW